MSTSHSSDVGIDFSDPVLHLGQSFIEPLKNIFWEKRGLNCPTRMFLINRVQIQTFKSRNMKGNVYCCIFLSCFSALLREKTWHFKWVSSSIHNIQVIVLDKCWKRNNEIDKVLVSQSKKPQRFKHLLLLTTRVVSRREHRSADFVEKEPC